MGLRTSSTGQVSRLPSRNHAPTPLTYRSVLSNFASGVVVVTAVGDEGPLGMTFQSFFSVSLEPPLIAVSPSRSSVTWRKISRIGNFCVNVLQREQADLCQLFGTRNENRFCDVEWSPSPATSAPRIAGCLAWLDCEIESVHEAGDHFLVVGRVLDLAAASGEPLVIYRRTLGSFEA